MCVCGEAAIRCYRHCQNTMLVVAVAHASAGEPTPPFLSQKTYNKPTSDLLNKIKQNYHQKQAISQRGLFQKYLRTATAIQSATVLDLESCGW